MSHRQEFSPRRPLRFLLGQIAQNVAIGFFLALISWSDASRAQPIIVSEDVAARIILGKVADYALPGEDRIGSLLRELGYSPSAPESNWRSFPAIRKLDNAYRAAEVAQSGGGDRFLAETIRKLSSEFESIANDAEMRAFAASHPAADRPLRFDEAASRTLTAVERAPYQVITKIANYVERGALGGAQVILTRDLGLGEREAYDILRSSSSTREALIQAYGQMNVDSRNVRLARLARQLQHTYASANADARLTAAIAVMAGAPTPGRGTTGSTCPAGESPCYCGARYVGCRPDILCTGPCR